ncbi:MAG: hypothetical protein A3G18_00260 [Rhodospirillales bacterium RIFCSPLOWO2_12_FULL_58_28]|nr:MAG: hypothetical protein A3H92_02870 [Rhodospirillales bacterium RIFCSPLOWO2_02_FULL_58_16]OHC79901.1 MAG: hypothetical protein A3G18_00260 [Rhodospirillales bacterium RIFCSPLOWO2_12_FULL_58_28]
MRQFLTVIAFSLFVISFFAGFSNFGIPQIEPAPPPVAEKLDLGAMTMEQFVALGEKVIDGKGTCKLCHNNLGRAPMLDQLGANVPKRLADPEYKGKAKDFQGYLEESMTLTSAYVVPGFGKKGTNDKESPMPDVTSGAISLSKAEFAAVIAYLQESSGVEITVEIPTDAGGTAADAGGGGEVREALTSADDIIAEFGCGACHIIGENAGDIGPDLSKVGARSDREYLRRSLLNPNADIAKGFEPDTMPADLGGKMYASEIEVVLDYLAGLK